MYGPSTFARGYVITRAKFVALKTHGNLLELSSSHPSPPLMLISPDECIAGLRRKTHSANVTPFSVTSAVCGMNSPGNGDSVAMLMLPGMHLGEELELWVNCCNITTQL